VRADGSPDQLLSGLRESSPYVVEVPVIGQEAARAALGRLGAVSNARKDGAVTQTTDERWVRLALAPPAGAPDLRETIAVSLARAGATPRELRREAPTLEQLFLEIIEADDNGPAPGRANGREPARAQGSTP
jgi:hypothetical protein